MSSTNSEEVAAVEEVEDSATQVVSLVLRPGCKTLESRAVMNSGRPYGGVVKRLPGSVPHDKRPREDGTEDESGGNAKGKKPKGGKKGSGKKDEPSEPEVRVEMPLVDYLATAFTHTSREGWVEHCAAGRVTIDGKRSAASDGVAVGSDVEFHRPGWEEPSAPQWVVRLFEDPDFLFLCKPEGLPVLPSEMYWQSCVWSLLQQQGSSSYEGATGGVSDASAATPAHRLGVGTSGLLLCGKTPKGRKGLCVAFEKRLIHKTYRALVDGIVEKDEFTVDCPIGPVTHVGNTGGTCHGAVPDGSGRETRNALSHMRVVHRDAANNCSLLEVNIPTGRAHQIRIHTAFAGHPLHGDPLYLPGGVPRSFTADPASPDERCPLPRDTGYSLHAWQVKLDHPVTGKPMVFVAPPPRVLCLPGEEPLEDVVERLAAAWN